MANKVHIKMALAVEATHVCCPPELSIVARKGISNLWTNSASRARPNAKKHKCLAALKTKLANKALKNREEQVKEESDQIKVNDKSRGRTRQMIGRRGY